MFYVCGSRGVGIIIGFTGGGGGEESHGAGGRVACLAHLLPPSPAPAAAPTLHLLAMLRAGKGSVGHTCVVWSLGGIRSRLAPKNLVLIQDGTKQVPPVGPAPVYQRKREISTEFLEFSFILIPPFLFSCRGISEKKKLVNALFHNE